MTTTQNRKPYGAAKDWPTSPAMRELAIHDEAQARTDRIIARLFPYQEGTGFYAGLLLLPEEVADPRDVALSAERVNYQRSRRETRVRVYARLIAKIKASADRLYMPLASAEAGEREAA